MKAPNLHRRHGICIGKLYDISDYYLLLMIVITTLVLPGCKKSGLFEGAGNLSKVKVSVGSFNEIVLNDKVNLILTYDSVEQVSLEAGENLMEEIKLTVLDNKLIINDNNKLKWSRDLDYVINVYVRSSRLSRLSYYGAGDIRSTNTWKAEKFTIDSWTGIGTIDLSLESGNTELIVRMANANIRLKGKSRYTSIYCADYGTVDLEHFESEEIGMDYRSIRNSTIYVTKMLTAKILYKGDVFYRGTPAINATLNSSGKLIVLP